MGATVITARAIVAMREPAKGMPGTQRFAVGSANLLTPGASGRSVRLTHREREVLSLLCEGLPNKLICRRLEISLGTVKIHIGNIMREMGASNRLQAVIAAQRFGLVAADGTVPDTAGVAAA